MMDFVASSTTGSNSGSLLPSTAVEEAGKTFGVDLAAGLGAVGFGAAGLFVAEDVGFGAAAFPAEHDGAGAVGFAGTATAILVADVVLGLACFCCGLAATCAVLDFTVAGTFLGMCTGGGCTSADTASRDDGGPLPDLRPSWPAEEAAAWVAVWDDCFAA